MRTARGRGVKGKAVQPEVELDDEDIEAIRRARASIRAGRKVSMVVLFNVLPESS